METKHSVLINYGVKKIILKISKDDGDDADYEEDADDADDDEGDDDDVGGKERSLGARHSRGQGTIGVIFVGQKLGLSVQHSCFM